ncbi:MAG: RluA family pseudouridine synthase [Armatimonadetes bacterium]|nr:RluA family pseudouridine synthase [Armatimonadota bacterium]MBI2247335.1 RluA family pseudouridine synthase [Armatimonadota bacterium]MBI2973315.1 RluA family pseudouridine synthase [Armatimonadota bacterium]
MTQSDSYGVNEPSARHHTYFVDEAHSHGRLDAFLTRHLPSVSRSRIKTLIESGRVTVDGAAAKPSSRVRRGQRVEVDVPSPSRPRLQAESIPLDIVFEDDHLMVINKPPGMAVHPGAGRMQGTLASAILSRIPQLAGVGEPDRPGIVHRLDKDTSGLLVVAKTLPAYSALQTQVKARTVNRRYLALVHGQVQQAEGAIAARIGRHPRHRTKMAVTPGGREAVTRYRVVERFQLFTLVEADLVTGRMHQIRVHFAHIGHPIVGDRQYGGRRETLGLSRQALHAWKLQFTHPHTGRAVATDAPLPDDFAQVLRQLRAGAEGSPRPPRRGRR